jgi:excisionase family DNA binding protein
MEDGVDVASANALTLASVFCKITCRRIFDVADAAKELRCHISTVYREIHAGRLNHYRVGNRIRITQEDIDNYRMSMSGNRLACTSQREREVLKLSQA